MNEFYFPMKTREKVAGWLYFPIHTVLMSLFILPFIFKTLTSNGVELDNIQANVIYYIIGFLYILIFMMSYLRRCYVMDKKAGLISTVFLGFGIYWLLSFLLVSIETPNPNNDAVMSMVSQQIYTMTAITVIMAPIVEEVLFRGVLYGSIRMKSKILAYVVSVLLFALYHEWSFIYAYKDWSYLLAIVDYIPAGIALAWTYEKSNNIWYPILLHMIINGLAIASNIAMMNV